MIYLAVSTQYRRVTDRCELKSAREIV